MMRIVFYFWKEHPMNRMITSVHCIQMTLGIVVIIGVSPMMVLAQAATPASTIPPTKQTYSNPTPPSSPYAIQSNAPAGASSPQASLTFNYKTKKRAGTTGFDVINGECAENGLDIAWTGSGQTPDQINVTFEITFEGSADAAATATKPATAGVTGQFPIPDPIKATNNSFKVSHDQLNKIAKNLVDAINDVEDGFSVKTPIPAPTTVNVWVTPNPTTTTKLKTSNSLSIKFQQVFP